MNAAFEALCRASAFGLAALVVALIAQFALSKRAPASWRAWIWRIALVQSAFALLPLAPIRWEILAPPTAATLSAITAPLAKSSDEFAVADHLNSPPLEVPDTAPIESAPPETQNAPIIESAPPIPIAKTPAPFDWRALVLAIYALGIAFQCTQLARGQRQLRRVLRDCTPNENATLTTRLDALAARLNLKTAPQLLIGEGGSPFLTGVWRPRIVLPRALCEAETAQLDAITAHELAHLKRRDLIWLGATWLLQTLLWFHPISWAACRFHGLETECACDELALQLAPIAPQSYGALLLNSMNNSNFSSPLAAGTCDTLFALKTRLLRLNNAPVRPHKTAKLAFVAALVLSCGSLVPLKLVARAGGAPIVTPTEPNVAGNVIVQGVVKSKQTGKPLAGVPVTFIPILPKDAASKKLFTVNGDGEFRDNWVKDMLPDLRNKQETFTDSRGYFRFNAIGRDHLVLIDGKISVLPSQYTEFLARQAVIIELKTVLKSDTEIELDEASQRSPKFALKTIAGDAVVQGVVTSKQTQKPLAGVSVTLTTTKLETNRNGQTRSETPTTQKTRTDARGYFRFNAVGGDHFLIANGWTVKVVAGKPQMVIRHFKPFQVKTGQKRNFTFELNENSEKINKPRSVMKARQTKGINSAIVQGVIVSKQTQKPLAGLPLILLAGNANKTPKNVAVADISAHQQTLTDGRGYFRFNGAEGLYSLLVDGKISLNAGKVSDFSAQRISIVVLSNAKTRTFQIALDESRSDAATPPDNTTLASASGQIVDENKRPLAGATAILYRIFDKGSPMGTETKSDANGRFRFEGLQLGAKFSINANKKGYEYGGSPVQIVEAGKNATFTVSLQAATAALRGVVIGEDGQPARNYTVQITHVFVADTKTDAQGRFLFPQALPGQNAVRVLTPKGDNGWGTFNVSGGEQNAKIRLTKSVSDARFPHVRPIPKTMSDKTRALIGKTAPEIKAARWVGGKTKSLQSLRGKVVLLIFDNFAGNNQDPWNDSARFTAGRLEIVGVQVNSGALIIPAARMNEVATNAAFPIALDAERDDENSLGGQTFSEYGMGVTGKHGYAIIGRDGKIIEAGDSLLDAFKFADRQ